MKHAFLIIAHHEPELLRTLVTLIDHPDCDIYIHIDLKSDMNIFRDIRTKHSKTEFIQDRTDVRWGDYSQILTEMKLFETAHAEGKYAYYHLMSGADLPLKPIEAILKWFEENKGYEYLGAHPAPEKFQKRMHRRYFFITRKRNIATSAILGLEKILGLKWNTGTEVWMSSNWGSFTHGYVTQILSNRKWIEKHFKYSFCGDELYKSTLMRHLGLEKNDRGSVLHVDWGKGNPYTFREEDYEELMKSDKLFARKFSIKHKSIISKMTERLQNHV